MRKKFKHAKTPGYSGPATFRGVAGRDVRPEPKHLLQVLSDELWLPAAVSALLITQAVLGWNSGRELAQTRVLVDGTFALLATMYLLSKLVRMLPRVKVMLREKRATASIGRRLEESVDEGGAVFHRVSGMGFQIDHVLLAPAGLFAISVEVLRQAPRCEASALFDGEFIHPDGGAPVREPVARAKVVARCLDELLRDWLGHGVQVQPVLLLPGWSIQMLRAAGSEAWVTDTDELLTYLSTQKPIFDGQDLDRLEHAMREFIRNSSRRSGHLASSGHISR